MYVPNPQKWLSYYEQIARGEHNAYIINKNRRTVQKGGSIGRSTVEFMDSIGPSSSRQKLSERIEMVSRFNKLLIKLKMKSIVLNIEIKGKIKSKTANSQENVKEKTSTKVNSNQNLP